MMDPETSDYRAEMIRELQQLRRGHGLNAPDIMERVGASLTASCGLDPALPVGARRDRLIQRIDEALAALPHDLQLAVRAAYGLPPASRSRFLRERIEWLGTELKRDPRTAIRRVESGLALLAEALLAQSPLVQRSVNAFAPDGWYVETLRSTLMLHVDPAQLHETRRITSTQNGLSRLKVSWSVPVDPDARQDDIHVEVLYGGVLEKDEEHSASSFWTGWVRLPRPLAVGEQHEYQVRVSSLPRRLLRPYYVFTPFHRCDEFELRAKFDRAAPPERIWVIEALPFQFVEEKQPIGRQLEPDTVGEVASSFRDLRQGLSYGLRWTELPG